MRKKRGRANPRLHEVEIEFRSIFPTFSLAMAGCLAFSSSSFRLTIGRARRAATVANADYNRLLRIPRYGLLLRWHPSYQPTSIPFAFRLDCAVQQPRIET